MKIAIIFPNNHFVLEIERLEIILGMDWLGKFKETIRCKEQRVILKGPLGEEVRYRRFQKGPRSNVALTLELRKLVRQELPLHLCHIN